MTPLQLPSYELSRHASFSQPSLSNLENRCVAIVAFVSRFEGQDHRSLSDKCEKL